MTKLLKVKLIRSGIGKPRNQRETIRGLGLTRLNRIRILKDSPSVRGMILKISHLLEVEAFEGDESLVVSARTRKAMASSR